MSRSYLEWLVAICTAFWPRERSSDQLGYPGMQEMPQTFHGQALWPVTRVASPPAAGSEGLTL